MSLARIPIVIVNFNAGNLLTRCVISAIACPSVKSIIVFDNHSTDDSIEQLNLSTSSSKLHIIKHPQNLGFASGNNRAIVQLNDEFILFLNPDCEITEHALVSLLDQIITHPKIGMVGPLILNEDGSEQRGCRRSEPTPLLALKTLLGKREQGINQVGSPLPKKPIEVDAISGACMLVRKEALADVGPMDEGYFLHCEDLDWCKRFWLKGWKVMFVPDATITHFKGGSSRSRPIRVEWHKHAGMVRYYSKFYRDKYPKPFMWLIYTAVWSRFIIITPFWWLKGKLA